MRQVLSHEELKIKISNILEILKMEKNKIKIWPPTSTAYDYNGFSQKTLEMIIRDDTLEKEIIKYKYLLRLISKDNECNTLFLHTTSKSILIKKRENIRVELILGLLIFYPHG